MIHGVPQTAPCSLMSPGRKPPQAGVHCAELPFPAGLLELKGKLPTNTEIPTDILTVFGHGLYHPQRSIWDQHYFILRTLCSQKSCSEVTSPLEASLIGKRIPVLESKDHRFKFHCGLEQKHRESGVCVCLVHPCVPVPGQCQARSRSSINTY